MKNYARPKFGNIRKSYIVSIFLVFPNLRGSAEEWILSNIEPFWGTMKKYLVVEGGESWLNINGCKSFSPKFSSSGGNG